MKYTKAHKRFCEIHQIFDKKLNNLKYLNFKS